ncbi:hypothetical protein EVAR_59282_1 [Eumeta japonica]|uniref:Uncharacterized protein n=1 Tax=Eumeta variegata TaxID=151549 RepID=A0A4C1T1S7_EUMVA|nr:hypothetical protein EVAR_59282_1 [Eumeta japonica]
MDPELILAGIEPAPKSSPTSAPPPPPVACSETICASLRKTDSNMSDSTLAYAIIFAIKSARKNGSRNSRPAPERCPHRMNAIRNIVVNLSRPINTIHHLQPSDTSDDELNDIVKRHFYTESLSVAPRKPSHCPEERLLALLYSKSVRLPSGQFETCLLWKSGNVVMPESYDTLMQCLRVTEKKLSKNDHLKNEYCEQINNLLKNGYAEPAPNKSTSELLLYLPHFAVMHL